MNPSQIQRVAVLGLGTMGHAIAQVFATAGYHVCGFDEQESMRHSLHDRIRRNLEDFAAADLVDRRMIDQTLSRVTVADSEEKALALADFVTEAVREDLATKQELLARIESLVSDQTILASNSSSFPISQSAARLRRPERAIVTHWFNPPHIVPTVEIVPGPQTSEATTQATVVLMRRLGKSVVRLNKEIPGFVVNRLQVALWREIWSLLDQGVVSPEDMDDAVRGTIGFRLAAVGPLEVSDFGGLDVYAAIFRVLARDLCDATEPFGPVKNLVEQGHYGVKTGRGFYRYTPEDIARKRSERDRRFLELLRAFYQRQGG